MDYGIGRGRPEFCEKFILPSGSLKEMAEQYHITYPTVRASLNWVIGQIKASQEREEDAYAGLIKNLAIEEKIEFDAAAVLIREYRKGGLYE